MADNVMVVNNSARVIHVGGTMLVPGMPAEVPASALENDQVKALMETPVEDNSKVMMIEEVDQDASPKPSVQESEDASTYDAKSARSGDSSEQSGAQPVASKPAGAATARPAQTTNKTS